jgi:hypothetical protein
MIAKWMNSQTIKKKKITRMMSEIKENTNKTPE